MIMKHLTLIFTLLVLQLSAQDLKKQADEQFNQQNWQAAAKMYRQHLAANEKDSAAWYRLALSTLSSGEPQKSLELFDKALETNFFPAYAHFSRARAFVRLEDERSMYAALRSAVGSGFSDFNRLRDEEEFAAFQEEENFLELIAAAKANAYPCLADEKRRHFDFWIGEWDVYVNGKKVGENNITLANGGCALHERYTTPGTYTGQSINYYDPMDEKWHQLWVSSDGGVLDYVEVDKDVGMLQFQCDYMNRQGQVVKSRLTFTANEDGTVRQFFENSPDGKAWTPGFDGLYKPRE